MRLHDIDQAARPAGITAERLATGRFTLTEQYWRIFCECMRRDPLVFDQQYRFALWHDVPPARPDLPEVRRMSEQVIIDLHRQVAMLERAGLRPDRSRVQLTISRREFDAIRSSNDFHRIQGLFGQEGTESRFRGWPLVIR